MGPRPMTALTNHLNRQLTRCSREAAATNTHGSHRQRWEGMNPIKGTQTLESSVVTHPTRSRRQLFGGLKQQAHPLLQRMVRMLSRQHAGDPQTDAGVQVMATRMHDSLTPRGVGQLGVLFHRQGIHIDPQAQARPFRWPEIRHHPRATHRLSLIHI